MPIIFLKERSSGPKLNCLSFGGRPTLIAISALGGRHIEGLPGTLKMNECKSGDYTAVVPPVPIPNTEVKCRKADDSALRERR